MNYKILIGEDSPSTQKLIQMSFPPDEFDIYAFEDGQEVLDSLSRIKPDAILLNLSLPKKDGYELGEYIQNQEEMKKVPLILIKEAFEPLDKERLETIEYEAIVQKPIDSEALAQMIKTIVEEKKVPMTLPEEPVLDKNSVQITKIELDQNVRDLVKREILSAERELEKRIKARVMAELKMWFINNQKK